MKGAPTIWNSNRLIYGEPAGMTPDRGFVKQLKRLDPDLDVVWNRFKERWIIIERGKETGRWHIVMRVQNEDGSYRPLDNRILKDLERVRFMFNQGVKAFCDQLEAEEREEEAQKVRDYETELHNIGDWYALQMMGIPHFQVPQKYQEVK